MSSTKKTHRELMPKDACPSLILKHMLTHGMNELVHDDRDWPGDGYYWCAATCNCIGPDDELVHPKDCTRARSCYDGPRE